MDRLAGIYCRISSDGTGEALGVQRQEEDARKLCADRGWTVVDVFSDNDSSAYDRRKPRKHYRRMLQAVADGRINTIVAWHPDRLHRQNRELVPFIDLINAHDVSVETITAGKYDLSTAAGRMNAQIVGSVAEYESEHKSERIRRKLEDNAAKGLHHGGSRPYGWCEDRVTVDPAEAAAVVEAAQLILAGESVRGVARALNAAGYRTSTGCQWRDVTVRTMLLRPRNAGLRVHHGEVVGEPGKWEPILSAEDYHQVEAILSNPSRRTNPGSDGKVHLISSIATCEVCDLPVFASKSKPYKGKSKPIYRCRAGHVGRDMAKVDELIGAVIVARLSKPDAADLLAEPERADEAAAAARRVRELQDRLNDAAQAFAAETITMSQLTTINAALRPKLDEAKAAAVTPNRQNVLGDLIGAPDPAAVWDQLPPARKRAVAMLLINVRLLRTTSGPRFDPESVEITWRTK